MLKYFYITNERKVFNLYYDLSKILSYNAFLNFLIGERGVGKTYSSSKFVTKQFINKGEEFCYIRRYKTELSSSVKKFFEPLIQNEEFPNHSFEVKGSKFYIDDKIAGYSMTLTTAQNLKSTNFSNVKTIIFDEFIIEDGQHHYLQNEVVNFLGLVETIARMRNIRILMLGNAVSSVNPYFLFFDLQLPYNSDIRTYREGLILVQYMKNEEYRKAKKESKFGKLVAGTEYEEYAIDNKFQNDDKTFIEKKSGSSKYAFSFIYNEFTFGVWFDYNIGKIFVSNDYKDNGMNFSTTLQDHKPNTMFLSEARNLHCWKTFVKNYKLGNVYFENIKIKSICKELIKHLIK